MYTIKCHFDNFFGCKMVQTVQTVQTSTNRNQLHNTAGNFLNSHINQVTYNYSTFNDSDPEQLSS